MDDSRPRVVYIVGMQNSGSTLLEAILGQAAEVGSLGEVGGFHRHRQHESCGCGAPAASCRLCSAIVAKVGDGGTAEEFTAVHDLAVQEKHLYRFLLSPRIRRRYAKAADLVFTTVFDHSSWTVLVDSSKNISRAIALAESSVHEIYLLHLVRDCRGYFYSRNRRLKVEGRRAQYLRTGVKWFGKNAVVSVYFKGFRRRKRFLTIRYEDLVTRPEACLRTVSDFVGTDFLAAGSNVEARQAAPRSYIFEPPRMVDYSRVRLDPDRLETQRWSSRMNNLYWVSGGFLSGLWGYDRQQSYFSGGEKGRVFHARS